MGILSNSGRSVEEREGKFQCNYLSEIQYQRIFIKLKEFFKNQMTYSFFEKSSKMNILRNIRGWFHFQGIISNFL